MTLPNAQNPSLRFDSRSQRRFTALQPACLCALLAFAALAPAARAAAPQPRPQGADSQRRTQYTPQQKVQPKAASAPLLSSGQGREVVAAALALEDVSRGAQDCSHLVHRIYADAGYDYPYASSFELYAGHASFLRVRHAQAGDLIAWRGHVGIVLNPKQHSFYSLVRSGLQAEDYQSPYWRSRGTPRFYRYVVSPGAEVRTAKATLPTAPRANRSSRQSNANSTDAREEQETERAKPAAAEASLRSKVGAPRVESGDADTAEVSSYAPADAASAAALGATPSRVLITAEQRRPTTEEALDGINELNKSSASVLRAAPPLSVKTPVVVFDELRVERIETKRDKGWAHVEMDSHVVIAADGADFKRRHEKIKWELRRDASGWQAIAPAGRAFVARAAAVRILSAQLAEMAQNEAAAQRDDTLLGQEARIANLLSALLEK